MSTIAPPTPRRSRSGHIRTPPRVPALELSAAPPAAPKANPHHRGGTVLFEVPFRSAMSDADVAVLARVLDLSTHMQAKIYPDPNSPGVARLDHFSGLFLERGGGDERWLLQARTWGRPALESVHEWHLLAAQAGRQLDPGVTLPEPLLHTESETPERPLGKAANGRVARFRRRLVGLP